MVCVVNLVSPEGDVRLDLPRQLRQINVVDILKRIPGVGDVNVFGRKYAMRIWLDPDRMANQLISPDEVITAIQPENRQAAAGKIGAPPVPAGQTFEYPITAKGRLETVAEFEEIIVRARPDGSIVRLRTSPGSSSARRTTRQAGSLNGKPAATIPIYQLSDANALDIVKQVRREMDRLAQNFPPGLEYRIAYDTTRYVQENITEVEHTLVEAFAARPDRRVRLPPGLPRDDHPDDRHPGLARGHVRADGGVRVLDQHAHPRAAWCWRSAWWSTTRSSSSRTSSGSSSAASRRSRPRKDAMAEITTPIVTITLVLAAVFVPVAFIPGLTGRLYNQFALTIVFSFVFSAINSLTFSPAMAAAVPPAEATTARRSSSSSAGSTAGMKWLENSYDAFLEFTARHWW